MGLILANDLSVSYFTYKDEYFTVLYVKPYTRLPPFLIGVLAGCAYFTYKREDPEDSAISRIFQALTYSNPKAVASHIVGAVLMILMVTFLQVINNAPNGTSRAGNLFYLLLSRPVFVTGFTMNIMPIILGCQPFKAVQDLFKHSFWIPFARLSYGAFLSHGVFMQFREFNVERG